MRGPLMSRRTVTERAADPECRYADEFAAALLMPEPAVKSLLRDGRSVVSLALYFGVPAEMVVYRLKMLGISAPHLGGQRWLDGEEE
jgi:Zn-dependent peptidase ImmA (M78 family)